LTILTLILSCLVQQVNVSLNSFNFQLCGAKTGCEGGSPPA